MRLAPTLLVALFVLAGCAGAESLRHGRGALASGDSANAVRHFERALAERPSLAEKPEFQRDLRTARREAALEKAREFADAKRWRQALAQVDAAREADPDHEAPRVLRARIEQGAAQAGYEQALAQADNGDLGGAEASLREALELVPGHADASRALESLTSPPRSPAFDAGNRLASEKRWDEAIGQLRNAVSTHPHHLPARARLGEAQRVVSDAEAKLAEGRKRLEVKEIDEAIKSLRAASAARPLHEPTREALAEAMATKAQVDELVRASAAALRAQDFDDAIGLAAEAKERFPSHAPAAAAERDARAAGAAHHTTLGTDALAAGDGDAAEIAFRRALGYAPDHGPAKLGLADLADARADAAASDGMWGSALLYRMDAADLAESPQRRAAVDEARAQVAGRAGADLELSAATGDGDAAELHRRVGAELRRLLNDVLRIPDVNEPNVAASVALDELSVRREMVDSSARFHPYDNHAVVQNPELPRLHDEAAAAEHAARRARYEVDRRERAYREAAEHARRHPESERARQKAENREDELDAAEAELERRERDRRFARDEYVHAPRTVVVVYHEGWPYNVETFRVTGVLQATVNVDTLEPAAIEARIDEEDETLRGTNPQLGLRDDPLDLPTEDEARDALLDDAAAQAAAAIAEGALVARLTAAQARAKEHADKGEGPLALEAEVDAAVLLESLDREAGQRRMSDLRRETETE